MDRPPPRLVTLVLATVDGEVLGRLPPFEATTPWWPDAEAVVAGALEHFGLAVTVIRLLDADGPTAQGGRVTYLAEVERSSAAGPSVVLPIEPWDGRLTDHPLRPGYAGLGGPAADLAWADAILEQHGTPRTGRADQMRTWNLSSVWRLPTAAGPAWLKGVPGFFAHEGAMLERLAGERVPTLLGHDGPRSLMADLPGRDGYDEPLPALLEMIDMLVELQARWQGRDDELLAIGLPDWRGPALSVAIAGLVERGGAELELELGERAELDRFVAGLAARFAAVDACGLRDGLVHGDFHPGNVRTGLGGLFILDWGDAGVGHPLLDLPQFLANAGPVDPGTLQASWHAAWKRAVAGSDPDRATALMAPIAAARMALIYQRFLDGIEPSEHAYHRADVPDWLRRTAAILRAE